jgi:heme oxygenase
MGSIRSPRTALRAATHDEHGRVDAVFSTVNLSHALSYGQFLQAQGAAQLAVEAALDAASAERVLPDWPTRRRAALLLADLNDLGVPAPMAARAPLFAGDAAVLGAVYVLEGSRFGGQLLKRSVGKDLPTRFLGASDPAGWRRLLAVLDERLSGAGETIIAIKAARDVFGLFERCGKQYLKVGCLEE